VARILAANDAGEAEDTAERVARAKLANAIRGEYLGGYRAYGYEGPKYNDKGELVNRGRINVAVLEEEKTVWLGCAHRVLAFEQAAHVARDLNSRGVASPGGGRWAGGNLKRLLTSVRYAEFDASGHPPGCPCLANPEGNGTLGVHSRGSAAYC
jgi:hypothetical protein